MARPRKCRRICQEPEYVLFQPDGTAQPEQITLELDEFETLRLVDLEKLTHEQCAQQMGVSRTTVTEMYERARMKLADALVNGKALHIGGGDYCLCDGSLRGGLACTDCPQTSAIIPDYPKEAQSMRIAVTHENGQVFQHFGHTAQFKFYDVQDGQVIAAVVVPTLGSGHGALAGFLKQSHVDALICGGIGGGARQALEEAGVTLYGGVTGGCDEAVAALLNQRLHYDPEARCDHHDHAHGEGHTCGEHNSCHH